MIEILFNDIGLNSPGGGGQITLKTYKRLTSCLYIFQSYRIQDLPLFRVRWILYWYFQMYKE